MKSAADMDLSRRPMDERAAPVIESKFVSTVEPPWTEDNEMSDATTWLNVSSVVAEPETTAACRPLSA